ncbi:MAG: AraC family transcriptional regulator [Bacteroidota bacterium]
MQTPSPDIYGKLVASKLFIDAHFDEAIDLEIIASHAYMSPFHFHRLFTKVYRITPHQYITKKRLEKAKELLKIGQVSIFGICTGVGFESHGSFSVLFKKYQGIAPKSYQTKALQLQQKAKEQPRYVIPSCFLPPDTAEKE